MDSPDEQAWHAYAAWSATVRDLTSVASLLGWDRETAMRPAGADERARQAGLVAALIHRETTRPEAGEFLARLADADLPEARRRAVELTARERDRALRVPEDLVRALSEARSRSVSAWLEARPADDYAGFRAPFREVVDRSREVAGLLADGGEPYDAVLHDYEPGATAATLEPLFADLRARLTPVVAERATRTGARLQSPRLAGAPLLELTRAVARGIGYDPERGAVAFTSHPFTATLGIDDVRFSTRPAARDPLEAVLIALHEGGHALYEQGLPREHAGTPVHDAPSLGAHESQSRFWENHVGRTPEYWDGLTPSLRDVIGSAADGLTARDAARAANGVAPSLIRVDADEATYNLHIALRFDLELRLFRGRLDVDDLPQAWNDQMQELVGVRPTSDADGVMQDIHWPEGLFGYFPTYTLGSVYAAQLAEAADDALGGLRDAIGRGEFAQILAFMRDRVHRHGNLLPTAELMQNATGTPLSADALIRHLQAGAALA